MSKRAAQASLVALVFALSACATSERAPQATAAAPRIESLENRDANLDVWFLDIGQGSCVFVDCPDDAHPLIIDCGSNGQSMGAGDNADTTVTTNWIAGELDHVGLAPRVVVSHADTDHYSLLAAAVSAERAPDVYLGSALAKHDVDFRRWLRSVDDQGSVYHFPEASFSYADGDLQCGTAIADVLIANATGGRIDNADSIVLALSYHNGSLIFAGDAESTTTEQAAVDAITEDGAREERGETPELAHLRRNRVLLSASHHGAGPDIGNGDTQNNGLAWMREWSLRNQLHAVLFSARPTQYGHPVCAVAERYEAVMRDNVEEFTIRCGRRETTEVSRRFLSAHENGHILVRVNASGIRIYCEVRTPACSGSIPANVNMPGRRVVAAR